MRIIKSIHYFFRADIPYGIGNLIKFFPVVWKFRPWDYLFNLELFRRSFSYTLKSIDRGMEVDETRVLKTKSIKTAIALLDRHLEGLLPFDESDREWRELWQIVSGDEDIPGSDMRGWWD